VKLCMVTPWGRYTRCGIRSYSENLAHALARLGVEVYIARWPRFGRLTEDIVKLVVEKLPKDVDLIHVQHEYGLFKGLERPFYTALARLKTPVVTTMHAVGDWIKDAIVASASRKVIVHNKFCYDRFQYKDKVVILPHGCEPVECPPVDECKRRLGINPKIPVVGYLGFISRYKGVERLVEAMAGVENAVLLIAGGYHIEPGTDYIQRLQRMSVGMLGRRVAWLGYIPDERLKWIYGAMDVLVYPSRFATESGALLTGLSHGRATIASDLPPFREKAEKGALMTFKDVHDLRRKIKLLLEDDGLRMELEEGARRYAESVRWYPVVAKKHISLYESILS